MRIRSDVQAHDVIVSIRQVRAMNELLNKFYARGWQLTKEEMIFFTKKKVQLVNYVGDVIMEQDVTDARVR